MTNRNPTQAILSLAQGLWILSGIVKRTSTQNMKTKTPKLTPKERWLLEQIDRTIRWIAEQQKTKCENCSCQKTKPRRKSKT